MNFLSSFYDFLQKAIIDRGKNSLAEVAYYAETERDLEIKGPCYSALPCWGEDGLEKIVEIALRNKSSKDTSSAIKVLALISAKKPISTMLTFISDRELLNLIDATISENDISNTAKLKLTELIMKLHSEDLLIPLGVAFTQISIADAEIAGQIVNALSSKWLEYGSFELNSFEKLLTEHPKDEPSLHAFLEQYPQMLDPMAIQVWSKPDFYGFREPDFLIRRSDNSYVVVEIENANKKIINKNNQISAAATHAVKQVNDYRSCILDRITEVRRHFPQIYEPEALVVIGLEMRLSTSQKKALQEENHSRKNLRIVGFDWILERSRSVLFNITNSDIKIEKNYRIY